MSSDLLMSESMHDVVLKVLHEGYSWRFPAHSLLLNTGSPVLKDMLEERMAAQSERPIAITIVGIQPDTILALLRFIYLGECPTDVTADLLVASDKYSLPSLRDKLEERVLPNLTVAQACNLLVDFETLQSPQVDCIVKEASLKLIEKYAYKVFSTDWVLKFSRRILLFLLESDDLNVPDEAYLFWGLWRWGRKHCAMNDKPLKECSIAAYLDDLIVRVRMSNLRRREGIPEVALRRFNRCARRRRRFEPPQDSLDQSEAVLRVCGAWEDVSDALRGEEGNLCLQVSFDRDVLLIGAALDISAPEKVESIVRIFAENQRRELLRQTVTCSRCSFRRLSKGSEAGRWLESSLIFSHPVLLKGGEMCSVYLLCESACVLPSASTLPRKRNAGRAFATIHGQAVVVVRELFLDTDVTVTWNA